MRIGILSGTRQEFDDFVLTAPGAGDAEYISIDDTADVLGVEIDAIQILPTFWRRIDSQDLYYAALQRIG